MSDNDTSNYLILTKGTTIPPKYFCHIIEKLEETKSKKQDKSGFLTNALAGLATINTINISTEKYFSGRKI